MVKKFESNIFFKTLEDNQFIPIKIFVLFLLAFYAFFKKSIKS